MIREVLNFTLKTSDEWEETVAHRLRCFLRYPHSYERSVLYAANTNGDSDSIACMVGTINGVYLALGRISTESETGEVKDYFK